MSTPDRTTVFRPSGALDIARAADFRQQLLKAVAGPGDVVVELSEVTAVDLAFFQVLCAAHRSAAKLGRGFTLDMTGAGESLLSTLHDAGISRHVSCRDLADAACLWQDGE